MPGQRIGYVRVSTLEQNTDRQLDGVVVERCFTDRASGKDTRRPELEAMTRFVREGDTLVVHSMDRLARNLDDLRRIVKTLTERRVCIEFVKEGLKFTGDDSPMANLMLSVMGAFAEFERSLLRERQREGIALAKQRGAYRGRKRSLGVDQIATAAGRGLTYFAIRILRRPLLGPQKVMCPRIRPTILVSENPRECRLLDVFVVVRTTAVWRTTTADAAAPRSAHAKFRPLRPLQSS